MALSLGRTVVVRTVEGGDSVAAWLVDLEDGTTLLTLNEDVVGVVEGAHQHVEAWYRLNGMLLRRAFAVLTTAEVVGAAPLFAGHVHEPAGVA